MDTSITDIEGGQTAEVAETLFDNVVWRAMPQCFLCWTMFEWSVLGEFLVI